MSGQVSTNSIIEKVENTVYYVFIMSKRDGENTLGKLQSFGL